MAAACSCSVPISRSTGTTSRTTKGSETKIVTSTIAGSANTTWIPCPVSQPPNQPVRLYSRKYARPTTTGDSASGRSTSAFTIPFPRKR